MSFNLHTFDDFLIIIFTLIPFLTRYRVRLEPINPVAPVIKIGFFKNFTISLLYIDKLHVRLLKSKYFMIIKAN